MRLVPKALVARFRTLPRMARWGVGAFAMAAAILATAGVVDRFMGSARLAAPAPETEADLAPAPLAPSHLAVPIRIDVRALLDELEEAVPRTWGDLEERHRTGDRSEVAFEIERGPFEASFDGAVARLSATLHYRARGWYDPPVLPTVSASCGTGDDELPPRLSVTLVAPLSVTPDWRLNAETSVESVDAVSDEDRDRCRVTAIRIDMTGRVISGAHDALERNASEIDRLVHEVDIRSSFEGWWETLAEPFELTDDVWLVMDPLSVRRGAIRGEGGVVEVPVTLRARPRVVVGPRPEFEVPPLPSLDTGAVDPGLEVLAEGRAEYEAASRLLTRRLRGETFERGERSVRVRSVTVSGIGGGRLALAVDVVGDARGVLYLVGTPSFDARSGQIAVPDLDFDVATADVVLEGASWLARVGLVGLLREQARWPAAPAVDWVEEQLERGLNRRLSDAVALRGSVGGVRILGVHATREVLLVRAAARAEATLEVVEEGG